MRCWPSSAWSISTRALARALSGGQQKLLELGRALMLDPALLYLDEPFAGVHPRLLGQILEHIRSLNDAATR